MESTLKTFFLLDFTFLKCNNMTSCFWARHSGIERQKALQTGPILFKDTVVDCPPPACGGVGHCRVICKTPCVSSPPPRPPTPALCV